MNNIKKRIFLCLGLAAALTLGSCDDQWSDEDVKGTESQTLWDVISSGEYAGELTSFRDALRSEGLDVMLQSSGSYTVLAPVNAAMAAIDADKRSEVPGSHIALLEFNKSMLDTMTYLSMYNGKLVILDSLHLDATEIVCRNGILRLARYATTRQPNVFERLAELRADYDMADFILSQGDSVMDMDKSLQTGVDEQNRPVYDTVWKYYNPLLEVVPLNNNDSLLSLVLLDNETFAALTAKYWPYLKQNDGKQPAQLNLDRTYRVDSLKTDSVTKSELVYDLVCHLGDAVQGSPTYVSTRGVRLTMDTATVTNVLDASNGNIQIASNVGIRIKDNKVKDVYIEAEDYYYTNEQYVFTRIVPSARGGKDVVVCGADSVRTYRSVFLSSTGEDSIGTVATRFVRYYNAAYANNSYPQTNTRSGGPVLGYKAPMFSCNYKIYWRSVDDRPHHCQPDSNAIGYDYEAYLENRNLPMAGVLRHVQKLYISQPGDRPLEYRDDYAHSDFVINYTNNNTTANNNKYKCMVDVDPTVAPTDVSANHFERLGINAGFAVDDPTYESPLIWASVNGPVEAIGTTSAIYYSGIQAVSTITAFRTNTSGAIVQVPRDIFICNYQGEATLFVTGAPFNEGLKDDGSYQGNPTSSNNFNALGSIFLDYIHLVPEIDE